MDKVSAVIPTYNRMDVICDAIDSILNQTYPHIEILVVDDGSTDQTLEILQKYEEKIVVIHQENRGCSSARNQGIRAASGNYIAFLDSDDKWLPEKIEKQMKLLSQAGKNVSCCWCNLLIESDGTILNRLSIDKLRPKYAQGLWLNPLEILATRFVLFNQAILIRKEALDRVGYFDESLWVMEDYDLAVKLAMQGPWVYTNESLVLCREGAGNRISCQAYADPARFLKACIQVYDRYTQNPASHHRKAIRHMKINRYFCVLDQGLRGQPESKGFGSRVRGKMKFWYFKIIKTLYRRLIHFMNMKTIPLPAGQ